jgi:hypothetical protein
MIPGRLTAEETKPAAKQTNTTPTPAAASEPLLTHFRGHSDPIAVGRTPPEWEGLNSAGSICRKRTRRLCGVPGADEGIILVWTDERGRRFETTPEIPMRVQRL